MSPAGLHAGSSEPQIITPQDSPKSVIFRPVLRIFHSAFQPPLFIVAQLSAKHIKCLCMLLHYPAETDQILKHYWVLS